jgi:transcriptional regulator with XRE-family HTH domain
MAGKRSPRLLFISDRLQKIFGQRLQQARRSGMKKHVQKELAEALGVSRTTVSNIERGQHRIFLDQVYIAARKLGIGIEELLPTLAEIFPETSVSTASDVAFDPGTTKAAEEVARAVSEQLASRTPHVTGTRRRR